MSSLDKMLAILDLFTDRRPVWSIEEARDATGYARSTLYRYCRSLTRAGLLDPAGRGGFSLGARIMDLERCLRIGSPLIRAARQPMSELARQTRRAVLLCRPHGDRVVCLHDELAGDEPLDASRRGQAGCLLRGATGSIVLGYLPASRLRDLHSRLLDSAAPERGPVAWDAFRDAARACRRAGQSHGPDVELLGADRTALAVPVLEGPRQLAATLTLAFASDHPAFEPRTVQRYGVALKDAARQVSEILRAEVGDGV